MCLRKTYCTSVQHNHTWRNKQNDQQLPKRSPNKTHQRAPRHDHTPVPRPATRARIPNHHQNTQKLRSLLRTQHHLPTPRRIREKRLRQKHLEHGFPKAKKSLPANQRRRNRTQLHRRLTQHNLQNNDSRQQNPNRSSTSKPQRIHTSKRKQISNSSLKCHTWLNFKEDKRWLVNHPAPSASLKVRNIASLGIASRNLFPFLSSL